MTSRLRPRRMLLSTASISVITILLLICWLYVFRYGSQAPPPPPILPVTHQDGSDRAQSAKTQKPDTPAPVTTPTSTNAKTHTSSTTSSTTSTMPAPGVASAPSVTLRQGRYVGATTPADGNRYPRAVESFQGIPYADFAGGYYRFRPPQPLTMPRADAPLPTFDAVALGSACPGSGSAALGVEEDEDCLNLNVYRPARGGGASQGGLLPVVVHVHGGAFNSGAGALERNFASFVSWSEEPLIAVNFNYRLGALGFLPSALTAREGLLNIGLRDQQMLFQWVQDNIEAFGGDPDNVTLMGLSAGSHSIGHHIMYYASNSAGKPPFAKAILESGSTTARAVLYPTHPRHLIQFRKFLAAAGVGAVPETELMDTLRNLPVQTIVSATHAVWQEYNEDVCWPFQPVIDGPNPHTNFTTTNSTGHAIIPDLPITSWRKGRHLHIPVLLGFQQDEGAIFTPPRADTNADFQHFFTTLIPGLTPKDLAELDRLYPDPVTDQDSPYRAVPTGMGRQWARLAAAYGHYAYLCPVVQTAHLLSTARESGSGSAKSPNVYLYRYAATARFGTANHGDEAPVVAHDLFSLSAAPYNAGPGAGKSAANKAAAERLAGLRGVADAMHGAWARFIVSRDGNPNPTRDDLGGGFEWPAFESPFAEGGGRGRLVVFGEGNTERTPGGSREKGTPSRVGALSNEEMERCRFWWSRIELSEGLGVGKEGVVHERKIRSRL